MATQQKTNEPTALSAEQTAARYGIAKATVVRWAGIGAMPPAYRVGGSVLRWRVCDLLEWEKKGFPLKLLNAAMGKEDG